MSTNPENNSSSANSSIVQRVRDDFLRRVLATGNDQDLGKVVRTFGPEALLKAAKLRPSEDFPG